MGRFGYWLVVMLLGLNIAGAAADAHDTPEQAALDGIARKAFAANTTRGFSYAVVRDGKVVFARGYGLADVAKGIPATPATRYAIGSVSKQFTAVAILKLAEQGKLRLEDKVGRYFPSLPNAQQITLQMLLNQTSGLHNYPDTREHPWPLEGAIAPARLMAILATDKPDFTPGERFAYANTNYFVLASIVEKVSGETYAKFLADQIFKPLGMTSSGSGFAAQSGLAVPYEGGAPARATSLDLAMGGGSVVSTAEDMARWDAALMAGKLLNSDSMKLLWTEGKTAAGTTGAGSTTGYAMGFIPSKLNGHREVWHNGHTPGAGGYTYNAIFPDDRLAVIVLSNDRDFRPQPEAVVAATLQALLPNAPVNAQVGETTAVKNVAAVEDPAATALARKIYTQMRAGAVDPALLTPQMQAGLKPEVLAQQKPVFDQLGDPTKLEFEKVETLPQGKTHTYLATFAAAQLHVSIFITSDGKVGGYFLKP